MTSYSLPHVTRMQLVDLGSRLLARGQELAARHDGGPHPGDPETRAPSAELRLVQAALDRLQRGTYGLCIDCEEPIPWYRLDAMPHASRCPACEARLEEAL